VGRHGATIEIKRTVQASLRDAGRLPRHTWDESHGYHHGIAPRWNREAFAAWLERFGASSAAMFEAKCLLAITPSDDERQKADASIITLL